MTIEFILFCALILGLSELKEWRAGARLRKLERLIRALPEALKVASERNEAALSFARTAAVELETLNRTVDAHGIRINYKPGGDAPHADFVEGL